MTGAVALAGMAALRGGAGLVRLAVADRCLETIAGYEPSYMTAALPDDVEGRISGAAHTRIVELAQSATVVALGPGLGVRRVWTASSPLSTRSCRCQWSATPTP